MLALAAPTHPSWTRRALAQLDELLLDHAHCEKKAAGMAVSLIFRYPQRAFLLEPLAGLAREELAHFEEVLRLLVERGVAYRPLRASPYAGRLRRCLRASEPERLIDVLLCSALIEARSCERFGILAAALRGVDPELAGFYAGLLASEARHHRDYVDLALAGFAEHEVWTRLDEAARHEAAVLAELREPRMHG
jgi:tRNA 2-(methylsulfanyl)-N6-isopentenyladenosine37 hydroxylase